MLISIAFSFWASSRFTFRVRHGNLRTRRFVEFTNVYAGTLAMSNTALWVLFQTVGDPTSVQESSALVLAGGGLLVVRFAVFRAWVFNPARAG